MLQVLVDADNLDRTRLGFVVSALGDVPSALRRVVVVGRASALERVDWPDDAELVVAAGWQRADLALAEAYRPNEDPLLLVSGDGDFAHLAGRHGGPVLVVSEAPSGALRARVPALDPVLDHGAALRAWLAGVGATS